MRSEPVVLRLRGGRLIDPSSGLDRTGDLSIAEGIVVGIDLPSMQREHVVDVDGCWVTPGFTDIHTHLREPGQSHKETIASGTSAAAAGGFTTVCAMANTDPVVDTPEQVTWVLAEADAVASIRVRTLAAVTVGLEGRELADHLALQAAGACAFSDDGFPLLDGDLFERALRATADMGSVIAVHAEDTSSGQPGIDARVAGELGCLGIGADAEHDLIAAHLEVLRRVPHARLHVAHLTTEAGVELVREAKREGLGVTAEVTPHHLMMTFDRLRRRRFGQQGDPFAKVNPPLRDERDRASLRAALADGTIDAIATDHAPHALAEKASSLSQAPSGLTGLETVVPAMCRLVADGHVPLDRLVDAITLSPARCFALPAPGLRAGHMADVTVIDPAGSWSVSPSTLRSRGQNTPLLGDQLRGIVRLTIHRGRIVHPEDVV